MALKVLAEKVNVPALDRESLTPLQKACACNNSVLEEFEKVGSGSFLLSFVSVCVCMCVCLCVHVCVCVCVCV